MAEIKLEGFRELEQELAKLGSHTTRRASARRAMRKAAQPMADLAQSMAPVGDTNTLANVVVSTKLSKRQAGLHRKMFRYDRAAVEMFIGPVAIQGRTNLASNPAAHTQEFGTIHHAPQPFLRPAWDQDQRAMLDRLKAELWADISRAVARAERRAARLAAKG